MPFRAGSLRWSHPAAVTAIYTAVALVMTWPLASVITTHIAGDTGDTFFNCWALLWTSGQLLRALKGDAGALAHYWNANIFYPAPLTLAYSEHLTPQMLQAFPILAMTGNIALAYNVLFLLTIVLSGLGMYLLVRELTGLPLAAVLAGLAFAFAPYRIDQFEHLQVLSSQWMPFALYGLRRFFTTRRLRPLAGGGAAIALQALSCGYYLAYFTPFVVAYALYEMGSRGLLRDGRTWRALVGVGAAVLLVVGVFLWPYMQARKLGDVGLRHLDEIEFFSADTHAYGTVSDRSLLWGSLVQARPHPEGQGFPGFAILAFAAYAVWAAGRRGFVVARESTGTPRDWRGRAAAITGAVLVLLLTVLAYVLVRGPGVERIGGRSFRFGSSWLVVQIFAVLVALLIVSQRFRKMLRGTKGSALAFFAWATLAAAWMSLGPTMYVGGLKIGPGLYHLFYRWVPGFNGLRVPALNFMLVALMIAVVAGLGAAAILSRRPRGGRSIVVAGMLGILAENLSTCVPIPAPQVPPVYDVVRNLPADTVIAEFPFGELYAEIRYTYMSGFHRKRILNGYSGFFPDAYTLLVARLQPTPMRADAWGALLGSGATHAVVHEGGDDAQRGPIVSEWLRRSGAREVATFGSDRMFQLR
jgi:hypothetical protein